MPTIVNRPNEVDLNGVRYLLGGDGQIHPVLSSVFAPKQVIGDYSKDSDPNRSIWQVFGDQTGGISIEEMDESRHANRSWWTNVNTEYVGHGFLAKLATTATMPTVNSGLAIAYGGTNITHPSSGNYTNDSDATGWDNAFRGKPVLVKITWNELTLGGEATAEFTLNDGVTDLSGVTFTSSSSSTVFLYAILGASATRVRIHFAATPGTGTYTISGITYSIPSFTVGTFTDMCDWNGAVHIAAGQTLLKVDASTGTIIPVAFFTTAITKIISSVGGCLYISMGDSTNYWFANTSYTYLQTTVANASLWVHWDGKLFKINASGQLSYSAAPNVYSPSWTNNGLIDTASLGTPVNLIVYVDASGNDIIYCATTQGLLAHDYANALWLITALQVPTHADNGKGLIVQSGKLYYSAGLSVYEYSLDDGSLAIKNVGLDKDDGVPDEYNASIVKFIGGYEGEFFAVLDAALISSSNYSTIIKYHRQHNEAWHPIWVDGTANETMGCGLVSSNYAYRLWFRAASSMIYLPLDRAKRNPLKTTTNYAASGIYLSPWFDADWTQGNKLALAVRTLAKATTSTETVTVKYRIDKTYTDLGTGWTTIDTLVAADANVESVIKFGSSAGVAFKSIQFRLEFARGGTTTLTPDLIYCTLEYEKVIPPKWGWRFVVDCSEEYNDKSPSQLLDALITAAETQTLVTLYYKDSAKYVRIVSVEGQRLTGDEARGQYTVLAVEK